MGLTVQKFPLTSPSWCLGVDFSMLVLFLQLVPMDILGTGLLHIFGENIVAKLTVLTIFYDVFSQFKSLLGRISSYNFNKLLHPTLINYASDCHGQFEGVATPLQKKILPKTATENMSEKNSAVAETGHMFTDGLGMDFPSPQGVFKPNTAPINPIALGPISAPLFYSLYEKPFGVGPVSAPVFYALTTGAESGKPYGGGQRAWPGPPGAESASLGSPEPYYAQNPCGAITFLHDNEDPNGGGQSARPGSLGAEPASPGGPVPNLPQVRPVAASSHSLKSRESSSSFTIGCDPFWSKFGVMENFSENFPPLFDQENLVENSEVMQFSEVTENSENFASSTQFSDCSGYENSGLDSCPENLHFCNFSGMKKFKRDIGQSSSKKKKVISRKSHIFFGFPCIRERGVYFFRQ